MLALIFAILHLEYMFHDGMRRFFAGVAVTRRQTLLVRSEVHPARGKSFPDCAHMLQPVGVTHLFRVIIAFHFYITTPVL